MRTDRLLPALLLLSLAAGCTQVPAPRDDPWTREAEALGPVDVATFRTLPARERSERRRLADEGLATLRLWNHRQLVGGALDFEMDVSPRDMLVITRRKPDGRNFVETVERCRRVVGADPTHARVWYELGRIGTETGDWARALEDLETAWSVLPSDDRARSDPYLGQRIALAGAFLNYDLGKWDEGLDWLDRHRGAWTPELSQEAMLARGLLQAGAGRFQEAYATALAMPPMRHRSERMFTSGLRRSGYANRWIQAMAWFHQGEQEMAVHALGTPAPAGVHIPQMSRYWNDVAVLFTAQDRIEEARLDHALGLIGRAPMLYHMPFESFSYPPVIHGQPHVSVPFVTIFEDRYVAGSLFSYGCQMMSDCSAAEEPELRDVRGRRALQAFSICMRRGDRPVLARALRGRTRFYMGRGDEALPDLLSARADLVETGRRDAVTSTVIGTIFMNREQIGDALVHLEEALAAGPELSVAWRTYGVALARVNRHDEADTAMDRAVELDPYAVGGWYNRGLHHINLRRYAEARTDLLVAAELSPDDPQIRQLLARVERAGEDADAMAAATARADSVRADLASGAWVARNVADDPDTQGGRPAPGLAPVDFAARADSLAAVHDAAPTPQTRRELAAACVRAGRPERALDLLASRWPAGLSNRERLLVLQADRDLGRTERARSMAADLASGPPSIMHMEFWTLVALICHDDGARDLALDALDVAIGLAPANHALSNFRRMLTAAGGS